nr:MAG TPA: hypothetical protein [Caudoviricetes sp.]
MLVDVFLIVLLKSIEIFVYVYLVLMGSLCTYSSL